MATWRSLALALPLASIVTLAACASRGPDVGRTASTLDITQFVLPSLSVAARAKIVHKYDLLDPGDVVPRGLLEDAMLYLDVNGTLIPKQAYLVVVQLSLYSGKDRFWLVDLATGAVEGHKVAHGDGSDPDNDGYATLFGNVSGSHKSSLGFALTGEIVDGTHPHSMMVDGLSPDGSPNGMANTNMRSREIIVHEAAYVSDSNSGKQGRSEGCFALDSAIEHDLVDKIHDGSLLYAASSALNAPVGRGACGDGSCEGKETSVSCPADCAGGKPGADAGSSQPHLDAGSGQPQRDAELQPRPDAGSVGPRVDAGHPAGLGGGEEDPTLTGGCSVGGGGDAGAGLLVALAWLGWRRRGRRRGSRSLV